MVRGRPTPPLLTGITCLVIEVCTLTAVLATPDLEYRLMIICVLTVPVLVSAHAMPLPWLGGQLVLVFFGVGLAAAARTTRSRPSGCTGRSAWPPCSAPLLACCSGCGGGGNGPTPGCAGLSPSTR